MAQEVRVTTGDGHHVVLGAGLVAVCSGVERKVKGEFSCKATTSHRFLDRRCPNLLLIGERTELSCFTESSPGGTVEVFLPHVWLVGLRQVRYLLILLLGVAGMHTCIPPFSVQKNLMFGRPSRIGKGAKLQALTVLLSCGPKMTNT